MNEWASGGLLPDLTLWIDSDIETGLARAARQTGGPGDRFESEALEFHQRVREGFLAIHRKHPERVVRIAGDGTIEEIQSAIVAVVDAHLAEERP